MLLCQTSAPLYHHHHHHLHTSEVCFSKVGSLHLPTYTLYFVPTPKGTCVLEAPAPQVRFQPYFNGMQMARDVKRNLHFARFLFVCLFFLFGNL